ncbi:glucose dehydrogenase [Actinomycetospora sp. NBRC 106375]|uniref:PQQ-dependent sugar dehydrogenase n=1 Tax=Actinomycetospora sp. NBRC 106375 TaxID=3032207 RepID=UPI00249FB810|nr:PQQ-dependent sugar dehydrogenase [Actinomycetospora sp. NBRC 106375]GLZ46836.1 glucose dehydrogenase [Actinomycetospora sp. NBRC 106375]
MTPSRPCRQPRQRPARALLALAALLTLALTACGERTEGTSASPSTGAGAGGSPRAATPAPTTTAPTGTGLRVETVAAGFDHPWDIAFIGGDRFLVTQRDGTLSLVTGLGPGARVAPVAADLGDVYARGEGGLLGIAAAPDVATSGTFVTCQDHQEGGRPVDIRLVTWRLSPDGARADRVRDPLVGGLPINPSGRHSGCRPTYDQDGMLLVGTGDTARATIAQDRGSLGGKVLRIDPATGGPAPGNPFAASGSAAERLIVGYGHRNVQGVAVQPGTGRAWSAEHGPDVDDEINVVVPGRNYGWDPAQGGENPGGYDESVPMTDLDRYPDAVPAAWSSGDPTEAISGLTFLDGPAWGDMAGMLAVSALKGEKLYLMRPGTGADEDRIVEVRVPPELDGAFGRLRGARLGPDGALYLTSDTGSDDVILRVTRA